MVIGLFFEAVLFTKSAEWPMSRFRGTSRSRAVAGILGALVVGGLMGGVALTHQTDISLGTSAGVVLGAILGRGVVMGTVGPATVFAVLFGLVGCMIGPGADDNAGAAGLICAGVGAFAGWFSFGFRWHEARTS